MNNQTKAKIFLATERGMTETASFSSYATFNFGKFFQEHKQPFGGIYLVNDDSLDAGCSLEVKTEKYSYLILLPVMGAISIKDFSDNNNIVAAGQVQIITSDKDETIAISNPFKNGVINFLQIGIKDKSKATRASYLSDYYVNKYPNALLKISPDKLQKALLPFTIYIGKFNGRGETTFQLKNREAGAFAFVVEGAFEVQGRLLHAGDALAVWDTREVEIEAFSNQAILLMIE